MLEKSLGTVLYTQLMLQNGQKVIRERVLLRTKDNKFFVDSLQSDNIKVLLCSTPDSKVIDDEFVIFILKKDKIPPFENLLIEIDDVILEIEQIDAFNFRVKNILRGGFIKSGNEVKIIKV